VSARGDGLDLSPDGGVLTRTRGAHHIHVEARLVDRGAEPHRIEGAILAYWRGGGLQLSSRLAEAKLFFRAAAEKSLDCNRLCRHQPTPEPLRCLPRAVFPFVPPASSDLPIPRKLLEDPRLEGAEANGCRC
jgi:hypothetical protein